MSNTTSNTTMEKKQTFPYKLHRILMDAQTQGFDHIISWMMPSSTSSSSSHEEDSKKEDHQDNMDMTTTNATCTNAIINIIHPFRVHKPMEFERQIMPMYFRRSTKYRSFQRSLHLWCFERISSKGHALKDSYHHPLFKRNQPNLLKGIVRIKNKGNIDLRGLPVPVRGGREGTMTSFTAATTTTNTMTSAATATATAAASWLRQEHQQQLQQGQGQKKVTSHLPFAFSSSSSSSTSNGDIIEQRIVATDHDDATTTTKVDKATMKMNMNVKMNVAQQRQRCDDGLHRLLDDDEGGVVFCFAPRPIEDMTATATNAMNAMKMKMNNNSIRNNNTDERRRRRSSCQTLPPFCSFQEENDTTEAIAIATNNDTSLSLPHITTTTTTSKAMNDNDIDDDDDVSLFSLKGLDEMFGERIDNDDNDDNDDDDDGDDEQHCNASWWLSDHQPQQHQQQQQRQTYRMTPSSWWS